MFYNSYNILKNMVAQKEFVTVPPLMTTGGVALVGSADMQFQNLAAQQR